MSLANSKRLWKHFKKIGNEVDADRVAHRAKLGYHVDGSPKNKSERLELGDGYDVTKEEAPTSKPTKPVQAPTSKKNG